MQYNFYTFFCSNVWLFVSFWLSILSGKWKQISHTI